MTAKEFFNRVTRGKGDFPQSLFDLLETCHVRFCVIGGLAVNAYAEPVVSLDLDLIVVSEALESFLPVLKERYTVEKSAHSVNVSDPSSELRIQIQTDPRYQPFVARATVREVLGYRVPVAAIEDLFQGKIWVAMDPARRPSKRQKDLADLLRLIEVKPELEGRLPAPLRDRLRRQMEWALR